MQRLSTFVAEFEAFRFRVAKGRKTGKPLSIIIGARACPASLILALSRDSDENILVENRLIDAARRNCRV